MTRLIVVDATPYGAGPSGARRRCEELLARLPALMPDHVFEVPWPPAGGGPPEGLAADNLVHATVDVSCRGGALRWLRRARDLRRRYRQAPFTHLLTDHGPVVAPRKVRNLVTLHDLRFLHGYGGLLRALYGRFRYGSLLRRAAAAIAVSKSVATEATAAYGLAPDRVVVAPNAPADVFRPPEGGERSGALVVGRDEPRKARGAAVAAAREAGVELEIIDGDVDDAALAAKYGAAKWLLAPSLLEGFDLPVVEALACGTPVIASDIGPHRDLLEAGATGIALVPAPQRSDGRWSWPEASAALSGADSRPAAPPAWTWDAAAALVHAAIAGG